MNPIQFNRANELTKREFKIALKTFNSDEKLTQTENILLAEKNHQPVGFIKLKNNTLKKIFGLNFELFSESLKWLKDEKYPFLVISENMIEKISPLLKKLSDYSYIIRTKNGKMDGIFIQLGSTISQQNLIKLFKKAIGNVELALNLISYYKLTDKKLIYQTAKITAQVDAQGTSKEFKRFNIVNEKDRCKIAQLCVKKLHLKKTLPFLPNFELSEEQSIYKFIKSGLKKETFLCSVSDKLSDYFKSIKFKDQTQYRKLLLTLAKNDYDFPKYFSDLNINDPELRYELAQNVKSASILAKNFKVFKINDIEKRIQIFSDRILKGNKEKRFKFLRNFQIEDEECRQKILISLINTSTTGEFVQYFDQFDINSEETRYSYSFFIGKKFPEKLAQNFKLFKITNQVYCYELALLAAHGNHFSEHLEDFGDFTEDQLTKIADIASSHDNTFGENFKKYIHLNRNFEYAKKFAQAQPNTFFRKSFKEFKISDQAQFMELTEVVAKSCYSFSTLMIPDKYLKKINPLYDFIVYVFQNNRCPFICEYITPENFPKESDRYQLAKLAYDKIPIFLIGNLEAMDLDDDHYQEFIPGLIQKNLDFMISYLDKLKISPNQKKEIIRRYVVEIAMFPEKSQKMSFNKFTWLDYDVSKFFAYLRAKQFNDWKGIIPKPIYEKFSNMIEETLKLEEGKLKSSLLGFVSIYVAILMTAEDYGKDIDLLLKDATVLYRYRNGYLRSMISSIQHSWFKDGNRSLLDGWASIEKTIKVKRLRLSYLLLHHFSGDNLQLKKDSFDWIFKKKKWLRDHLKAQHFHEFLIEIDQDKNFHFFQEILTNNHWTWNEIKVRMESYLDLKELCGHVQIDSLDQAPKILKKEFLKLFQLEDMNDFEKMYQNTFAKFRNRTAIYSYSACLKQLRGDELNVALGLFSYYIKSVLNGTFQERRYDINKSKHLELLFKDRPELLKAWKQGDQKNAIELIDQTDKEKNVFNFKSFFKEKILIDKHLGENYEEEYPLLHQLIHQNFRKKLSGNEAITVLKTILGHVPSDLQFYADVQAAIKKINCSQIHLEKLKVYDTDDPCHLLLIGTETSSCQSVNGSVDYNKCLLAYLLDGKNRAIVVTQNGKIIARAILRILIDKKTKEPVLFLERIYSNSTNPVLEKLIDAMAIKCGERLNLPVLSKGKKGDYKCYPHSIISLESVAPYEYVDSGKGVTQGKFRIKKSLLISHLS